VENKRIVLSAILLLLVVGGLGVFFFFQKETENFSSNDAEMFASEYNEVSLDNVFVYKSVAEIVNIMEHGTGVVYLGYPECPWCQAYVKYLNEVAKEVGVEKINYCNTKKVKEDNMEDYQKLISLLDGHLQYNSDGEQWIYVPNVSFHVNGEILFNDYETSKDTHDLKDPKEYWTAEEITDLKARLTTAMKKVKEASEVCTDCNK